MVYPQIYLAIADACYDRGSTFCLKRFLNDGTPLPKIIGNRTILLHDSRCVSRPWDFSSGGSFVFLQNQFFGEVLSSQIEEPQKKGGAPLS